MNDNNRTVYVMLSYTGTFLSRAIKKYTKAPYSHVSISLEQDLTNFYSFGRKISFCPLWGGFVTEELDKGVYKRFKNAECGIFELKVNEEQYFRLKEAIEEFQENVDKLRYNFIGLITCAIGVSFKRSNYYFCSQFVDAVFKKVGIEIVDKPSEFVTPTDFLEAEEFKLIYTGKIKDLACNGIEVLV